MEEAEVSFRFPGNKTRNRKEKKKNSMEDKMGDEEENGDRERGGNELIRFCSSG